MTSMDNNLSVLLFAHPRSGSNTLMKILNIHPSLNMLSQPFNESRDKYAKDRRNYRNEADTIENFGKILDEIKIQYNGIKTFSFQLPESYNVHLLTKRGYKVIFLHRKNHLKSAVSKFIAEQTQIWTADEKEQRRESPKHLEPIDLKAVSEEVMFLKDEHVKYLAILKKAGVPFFEILYEDLFAPSEHKRMRKVEQMFQFLGLRIPIDSRNNIKKLLSPQRKITDLAIYNLVPNIEEIEQKVGSETNGFLFKD